MAGRYDDKIAFIERLDPIIRRHLEIYREDPAAYVRDLPLHINSYFAENCPSRKIPTRPQPLSSTPIRNLRVGINQSSSDRQCQWRHLGNILR
jgi:hypothetical protein